MASAYVLINTETGATEDALNTNQKIQGIKETHLVYGVYGIIIKVEAESMSKLKDILSRRIRRIDKIKSTTTMILTN